MAPAYSIRPSIAGGLGFSFSRYVTAVPQVYCVDFDKKILLVEEVTDSIQGIHFDVNNENGKIFRNQSQLVVNAVQDAENMNNIG